MEATTIGQLAALSGLSVRTLRFYADAGVLPAASRSASGYRLFDADATAQARLLRTLRELGVGLDDITRVLSAEASLSPRPSRTHPRNHPTHYAAALPDVAAAHAQARRPDPHAAPATRGAAPGGPIHRSTDPKELERTTSPNYPD